MAILYEHSKSGKGLILNCLDLPGTLEPERALSTEKTAFMATLDLKFCADTRYRFPQRSMRWSHCGLGHSNTRFHIACDGFGNFINVHCGTKAIFFATLISDHSVAEIDAFSRDHYSQDIPPDTHWRIESVILRPGSTL